METIFHQGASEDRETYMTPLKLTPRVKAENGRFIPTVAILDPWGDESVFCGRAAPTHAAAFETAARLVAAAKVDEPVVVELPPAWK